MKKFKFRILPVAALLAAILLVAAYFFLTGSFFLTRMALPLASRMSGVRFSADSIDWRPWSARLTIRQFRLGDEKEPFLEIRKIRGFYNFFQCLRGVISFRDVEASGVRLHFISNAAEQWNYDQLSTAPATGESESGGGSGVPAMEFFAVAIEDSEVLFTIRRPGQTHQLIFSELNLKSPLFGTGRPMELAATGKADFRTGQGLDARTDFDTNFRIDWDRNLNPARIVLDSRWQKFTSLINDHQVSESGLVWNLSVRNQNGLWIFDELKLAQQHDGGERGFFDGTGSVGEDGLPFAFDVRHFMLPEELIALSAEFFYGINPGVMTLEGEGKFELSRKSFSSAGTWRLDRQPGKGYFDGEAIELPGFALQAQQDFSVDFDTRRIEVRELRLEVNQSARSSLRLFLRKPVNYDLAQLSAAGDRPGVTCEVSDFDLKLLRFAMPENRRLRFDSGSVSGVASFDFSRDLSGAKIYGGFAGRKIGFHSGKYRQSNLEGTVNWEAEVGQNLGLIFRHFVFHAANDGKVLGEVSGEGNFHFGKKTGSASFEVKYLSESLLSLLPEEPRTEIGDKLKPFVPLSGTGSGKLDFTPERLRVDAVKLAIDSRRTIRAAARLEAQEFLLPGFTPKLNWKIQLDADGPLLEVNPFLPKNILQFTEGRCNVALRFDAGSDFATATTTGNFAMNNVAGRLGSTYFRDVIIQDEFSAYRPENGRIQLNTNTLYWRVNGRPALRIETPGSFDPVGREWESRVAVRYLNENFVGLFLPGRIRDGLVSGNLKLIGRSDEDIKVGGYFQLEKIRPVDNPAVFDGQFSFEFDGNLEEGSNLRKSRLRLHSGPRQLIDAELSAAVAADPAKPIAVRLTSYAGDLEALRVRTAAPALPATGKLPAAPKVELHQPWNFGSRPIDLQLNLDNLNWGAHADFGLSGFFRLQENRISTKNAMLMFNGCPFQITGNLLDTTSGMALSCSGNAEQPLELGELVSLFRPGVEVRGDVSQLGWQLNIRNLLAENVIEGTSGSINGRLGNVVLSSRSLNSPFARMLLLPVEAIVRTASLLPASADPRKVWASMRGKFDLAQSPLAEIKLDRGELAVELDPGMIHVRKLDFSGPILRELKFSGDIQSGGEQSIKLESRVNMGGVKGKFPITGTLDAPVLKVEDVLMALTGGQVSDALKKFGSSLTQLIPGSDPAKKFTEEEQQKIRKVLEMMHLGKPDKNGDSSPK